MPGRKPLVVGNWKMNTTADEAAGLAQAVADTAGRYTEVDIVLCPPFVWLEKVGQTIQETSISLGAQNMHWEDTGAFTGEISAAMLRSAGCSYVILGHSERRQYFGETDQGVNRKIKKAIGAGLIPIVCLGETLEQRERNLTEEIVNLQFEMGFRGIDAWPSKSHGQNIVIAYEPVWAIGTGRNATPRQAQEVHYLIRGLVKQKTEHADLIRIIYGGSVKPSNARELFAEQDIDGFLVGGASLKAADFSEIVRAASGTS